MAALRLGRGKKVSWTGEKVSTVGIGGGVEMSEGEGCAIVSTMAVGFGISGVSVWLGSEGSSGGDLIVPEMSTGVLEVPSASGSVSWASVISVWASSCCSNRGGGV